MMKRLILKTGIIIYLLLGIWLNSNAQLQDDGCGTKDASEAELEALPWYGNNQYLYDILDSSGYYNYNYGFDKVMYRVPVKIWVFRENAKSGTTEAEVRLMMQNLNLYNVTNNTGIIYYLREVKFVNSKRLAQMGYNFDVTSVSLFRHTKGCVNVYVSDKLIKWKPFRANQYMRGLYHGVTKSVFICQPLNNTSLAHEIAHYFGLFHPHNNFKGNKCKQEAVSRTRKFDGCFGKKGLICETSGDGLCDTPAEPVLEGVTDTSCRYFGRQKDLWGDTYQPETHNIMSYPTNLRCRTKFTAGQVGVMLHYAKKLSPCGWNANCFAKGKGHKRQYNFDEFEPNNTKTMASEIFMNLPQKHTFHKTYVSSSKDLDNDVDWLKFEVKPLKSGKLEIFTSAGGFANPDTEIALYDAADRQIAADDNSGGAFFSKISVIDIPKGWYFIKITKKAKIANPDIGDYTITIKK